MKKLYRHFIVLALLALGMASFNGFGQYLFVRSVSIVPNSKAYWEYLPVGYNPNDTARYPLIVYIHGAGDYGNGTASDMKLILRAGPLRYISLGQFPQTFTVNGKTYGFIVVSPQFMLQPTVTEVNSVIDFCIATYKVDISRIYLTGLSMGGALSWQYPGTQPAYANRLAGIVPVCGQTPPDYNRGRVIAASNLPVWATHNDGDPLAPVQWSIQQVAWINEPPPPNPLAMLTIFHAATHDAWTTTYNPTFSVNNLNIYQWMLTYSRASAPAVNQPPVVNAGAGQSITLPASTATLTGSATDNTGTITSHTWTFVSGPATPVISDADDYSTAVTGLTVAGVYTFRLTATDDHNLTGSATTQINVSQPTTGNNRLINVNIYGNNDPYSNTAWNNWNLDGANPVLTSGKFNYSDGTASGISAALSAQTAIANNLTNYVTVLMCPQKVAQYASYYSTSGGRTLTLAGLDTTKLYRLELSASRYNPQQITIFGINGKSITIPTYNNADSVATFDNLAPATGGKIVVTITHSAYYDYLNGFTITEKTFGNANPPVANAGPDQAIILPVDSVLLDGSASRGVNPILSYQWTILSGGPGNLESPTAATTILTGLSAGTYKVQLKVTDDSSRFGLDTVVITVNSPAANKPPAVIVGPNQTISGATASLTSTANDPENVISSRLWTKVSAPRQKILRIGVIGSSTMYGTGPANIDSSLVNRVRRYYEANRIIDTIYNLAVGGSTVYNGVTADFIPPGPTPNEYNPASNVTAALAKGINVLIVGYPTNGYEVGQLTIPEIMAAHQNIFNAAKAAGVPCYISSTQPRSTFDAASQARLLVIRDSLLSRFGAYCMDFMTPLVYPGTYTVLPQYDAGDGVHLNSAAHAQLAAIVEATNPFSQVVADSSVITSPASANTTVTRLDSGVYKYQMSAFDQYKLAASAIITLTVARNAPLIPVANAGPDQSITLPSTTTTLTGSGSEPGGRIVSYKWAQTSGAAATIANPASATTNVSGLNTAGAYGFALAVTDSVGTTASDTMTVIVNPTPLTQNKIVNVNIYGNNDPYTNAAWNNWNLDGANPVLTSGKFNYSDGTVSGISAALSAQTAIANNLTNYVTVLMCPQKVAQYASYYSGSGGRTLTLAGLDSTKLYRLDLFATRYNPQQITIFGINGKSITIPTYNNTDSVATFDNVAPATGGKIVLTIAHTVYYDYLNGFTITEKTPVDPDAADSVLTTAITPTLLPSRDSGSLFEQPLSLYPNPTPGVFELHVNNSYTGRMKVDVFNESGKLVKEFVLAKAMTEFDTQLSLGGLPEGGYFLVAAIGDWRRSVKLLKF